MRWDIFCRVIDNYGDAGVCWRLAADLDRRGEEVTLYIDEPDLLARLIDPDATPIGVQIKSWPEDCARFEATNIADVVIEAFACDPPAAYIGAMAERAMLGKPPAWINLEYLSAEDWVGSHHRLPSPHPRYPLIKHFYFPGFTPDSGGLLREPGTIVTKQDRQDVLTSLSRARPLRIFLFSYEQPALQSWLHALTDTTLSVAPCPGSQQIIAGPSDLPATLAIQLLPFVPQSAFDAVLRAHDMLFVRGEDSFVRAQLAGKPLVWHIYPQAAGAHLEKLHAFYARYLDSAILTADDRNRFMRFIDAWNGQGDPLDCAALWPGIARMLPVLQKNALAWREMLLKQPDLVTQLRAFVADLVK